MLNLNAWLILELCDGCAEDQILQRYLASGVSLNADTDAGRVLGSGLRQLEEQGLVVVERQNTGETVNGKSSVGTSV
jgi:hypothetical protein